MVRPTPSIMLANRINQLTPSPTLSLNSKIKELQAQGLAIINLTAGEPDFAPPSVLKEALIATVNQKCHHYTPVAGILELRQAIAQKYRNTYQLNYQADNVIVSSGAKQVLYNALASLINPEDEVIVYTPTWSTYIEQIKLVQGVPVFIDLEPPFQLTAAHLEAKITNKTKAVILNYPHNPTGQLIALNELRNIIQLAKQHQFWLISDEIYETIVFDDQPHQCLPAIDPTIQDQCLVVSGLSKSHAITGWRLGWGCGPQELIRAMTDLQGQMTSGASSVIQQAALAAFLDLETPKQMARAYQDRRDQIWPELASIPGLKPIKPQGAFYLFVDIRDLLNDTYPTSASWCQALLTEQQVAVVPGEAFLAPGYFRLSFAAALPELLLAVEKIRAFVTKSRSE